MDQEKTNQDTLYKIMNTLSIINEFHKQYGWWPSVRELVARVEGISSTASLRHLLDRLEEWGYLYRKFNTPRAMRITDEGYEVLAQRSVHDESKREQSG